MVGNNPANVGENVTINCTTMVVSGITLWFGAVSVNPSTNPRVTVDSQTATTTIYTFANVTKGNNGLNISCTIIETGNVITTLGHTILVVQCEFCVFEILIGWLRNCNWFATVVNYEGCVHKR